eukprot:3071-Pelagococcus_subviridis.AAC.2
MNQRAAASDVARQRVHRLRRLHVDPARARAEHRDEELVAVVEPDPKLRAGDVPHLVQPAREGERAIVELAVAPPRRRRGLDQRDRVRRVRGARGEEVRGARGGGGGGRGGGGGGGGQAPARERERGGAEERHGRVTSDELMAEALRLVMKMVVR